MRANYIFTLITKRLIPLLRMPAFWVVTIVGNSFVAVGAFALYFLENGHHAKPLTVLDSISWAVGLVTTIGYSDLIPVTTAGKVLGIIMMIGGTLFLWSYMGLLVSALFAPDISLIEREIKGIKKETTLDDHKIDEIMRKIDHLYKMVEGIKETAISNITSNSK